MHAFAGRHLSPSFDIGESTDSVGGMEAQAE